MRHAGADGSFASLPADHQDTRTSRPRSHQKLQASTVVVACSRDYFWLDRSGNENGGEVNRNRVVS